MQYVVASCHHVSAPADSALLPRCKLLVAVRMNILEAPTNDFVCVATCSVHAPVGATGFIDLFVGCRSKVGYWFSSLWVSREVKGAPRETLSETRSPKE